MYEGKGSPRLRVLHASPDAPVIDIYIDGAPAVIGLAYGEVSDYIEMPSDRYTLSAFPMGAAEGMPLFGAAVELGAAQDYTVVAMGRVPDVEPLVLLDSTPFPAARRAKVRAVHASPDAPPVDVAVAGGPILFRGLSYRQATPYQEVPAGRFDLEVRPSGSERPLIGLPYYTLDSGSLYTFAALGLLQGTPAFMIMPLVEAVQFRLPT